MQRWRQWSIAVAALIGATACGGGEGAATDALTAEVGAPDGGVADGGAGDVIDSASDADGSLPDSGDDHDASDASDAGDAPADGDGAVSDGAVSDASLDADVADLETGGDGASGDGSDDGSGDGSADSASDGAADPDADGTADGAGPIDAAGGDAADAGDASSDATDAAADVTAADAGPSGVVLAPIDPTKLPPAGFFDVTSAYGVAKKTPHSLCVAAADLDGDGREDFVVVQRQAVSATIHTVLLPPQGPQSLFTKVDTTVLLPTSACILVDLTDDGHPDLIMGGASGLALYAGDGKGGFQDASETWLPYFMDFSTWSPVAGDLDGDGDLDLFVGAGSPSFDAADPGKGPACGTTDCGYKEPADFFCALATKDPNVTALQNRVLLRGPKPPLVDVTKDWKVPPGGLLSAPQPIDLDADGKLDILISDDFGIHYLLRNVGGAFAQHQTDVGLHPYGHGMGFGINDVNGDGKPDLWLADEGPSHVYVQHPVPAGAGLPVWLVDEGGPRGVHGPTWSASSWSPLTADFDRDGNDDVFLGGALWTPPDQLAAVTAGCTKDLKSPYEGHPNIDLLLMGTGQGSYVAKHLPTGPYSHFMAISQVLIDLEGDGDLDVVQARPAPNLSSTIRIWRNDLVAKGGFVRVRLQGKPGNREAIGAVVRAKLAGAPRSRWLLGNGGYGGTRAVVAEFGLGASPTLDEVQVTWPDGKVSNLGTIAAGKTVVAPWP